jgi:hypothetical protein
MFDNFFCPRNPFHNCHDFDCPENTRRISHRFSNLTVGGFSIPLRRTLTNFNTRKVLETLSGTTFFWRAKCIRSLKKRRHGVIRRRMFRETIFGSLFRTSKARRICQPDFRTPFEPSATSPRCDDFRIDSLTPTAFSGMSVYLFTRF